MNIEEDMMKKIALSFLMLTVILSLGSMSFAEDVKGMPDKEPGMKKGMMMKDKKMGMMGPMMMKMMMDKSVVATSDAGIVVVAGNILRRRKYSWALLRLPGPGYADVPSRCSRCLTKE